MRVFIIGFILLSFTTFGQIPQGYYDSASGLSGQQLRAALKAIIDDHQEQSYTSLWTHFQSTDDKADGKVWDMYSDVPGGNPFYTFTFVVDQCGNYSSEGDCYNREHSFPSSWFNDASPMLTDLFHIYPTDGFVNGKRSNYPYGEVNNASWTSLNGSKLGNCSFTGYSGIVFEPIDEYKGDFARTYFYMMTRYMDEVASWNSDMLSGNDLTSWAKEMLLEWDTADPVSQKEVDRNNAVYQIQNNRNPFIDHPEFTGQIWGFPSGTDDPEYSHIRVWYSGGNIHIDGKTIITGHLAILNIIGQQLFFAQINNDLSEIPLKLVKGIYLVILDSGNELFSFKLVIAK
jgi:endonuclease I